MLGFPIKTLNTIKRVLLRQQKEVEKDLKQIEEDDPAQAPSLAESSEPGTDSYIAETHGKTLVLKNMLINLSSNIKRALTRIRNGNYGKCEKCGRRIEVGRLLAMPTATLCLSCSKKVASR